MIAMRIESQRAGLLSRGFIPPAGLYEVVALGGELVGPPGFRPMISAFACHDAAQEENRQHHPENDLSPAGGTPDRPMTRSSAGFRTFPSHRSYYNERPSAKALTLSRPGAVLRLR